MPLTPAQRQGILQHADLLSAVLLYDQEHDLEYLKVQLQQLLQQGYNLRQLEEDLEKLRQEGQELPSNQELLQAPPQGQQQDQSPPGSSQESSVNLDNPYNEATTGSPAEAANSLRRAHVLGREVNPYRDNAFRILGIGVQASSRDVSRRARELRLQAELNGGDPARLEQIRAAEAALQDPVRRLREELYWVLLSPDPIPLHFRPADAASAASVIDQLDRLAEAGSDAAEHDLAVVYHLAAIEAEDVDLRSWDRALWTWGEVWKKEAFWFRMKMRAEELADPRVSEVTVDALRADLPVRVLHPSGALVGQLIEDGRDDDGARHLAAVLESEFPAQAIETARSTATAELRSQVTGMLDELRAQIEGEGSPDPSRAPVDLGQRLRQAWEQAQKNLLPLLERFRRVDPDSTGLQVTSDAVAQFLQSVSVRLYNEAGDGEAAMSPLQAAERLASSESVRQRVTENLRTLRGNLAWSRATQHADAQQWAAAISAAREALRLAADEDGRRSINQFIATCEFQEASSEAVAHANAGRWQAAIVAAGRARQHAINDEQRRSIDQFVAHCRQAATPSSSRYTSVSTQASRSGPKLSWLGFLGLGLLGFLALLARTPSTGRPSASSAPAPNAAKVPTPTRAQASSAAMTLTAAPSSVTAGAPSAPAPTLRPAPTSQPVPTPTPAATPVSLPNGTRLQQSTDPDGRGWLKIVNGTPHDAVAKLKDAAPQKTRRVVYIRAGNSVTLEKVGVGTYVLQFMTGIDWDREASQFRREASAFEFTDRFDFRETPTAGGVTYSTWEVSLNPVPSGTARTNSIDPAAFAKD